MTPEQTTEVADLLKKQLRVQKRSFVVQLIQMLMITVLVGMWLYLFMYSV